MCPFLMIRKGFAAWSIHMRNLIQWEQHFRILKTNSVHHTATIKKSEWQEHIGDNHNPDNVDEELLKNSLHICSPREEKLENWLSKTFTQFLLESFLVLNCKEADHLFSILAWYSFIFYPVYKQAWSLDPVNWLFWWPN